MKISLITDEISADPETEIELGVEWGVHDFELRGFGTDRVPTPSAFQKQRSFDAALYNGWQAAQDVFKRIRPPDRRPADHYF